MNRELPVFNIQGTDFFVDIVKTELRECQNPANTISFNEMQDDGEHYTFGYDTKIKNLPNYEAFLERQPDRNSAIRNSQSKPENFFARFLKEIESNQINIPYMIALDPMGMSLHYKIAVEEFNGKTDFDIIVDQKLYHQRLQGKLPEIDILGHPFYVDIRMGMLRPKDDFLSMGIRFDDMTPINADGDYRALYNPKTHELVQLDTNIQKLPKNLVVIEMKNELYLDPVGFARHHDLDVKSFVRNHMLQKNLKAAVVDWNDTEIPEIIKKNNQKGHIHNKPKEKKAKKRKLRKL